MKIMKIQQTNSKNPNTYVNIPKDIIHELDLKKADTVLVYRVGTKVIIETNPKVTDEI